MNLQPQLLLNGGKVSLKLFSALHRLLPLHQPGSLCAGVIWFRPLFLAFAVLAGPLREPVPQGRRGRGFVIVRVAVPCAHQRWCGRWPRRRNVGGLPGGVWRTDGPSGNGVFRRELLLLVMMMMMMMMTMTMTLLLLLLLQLLCQALVCAHELWRSRGRVTVVAVPAARESGRRRERQA